MCQEALLEKLFPEHGLNLYLGTDLSQPLTVLLHQVKPNFP